MQNARAIAAVDAAISELVNFDLILVENGRGRPFVYVDLHRHEYIRTVSDVLEFAPRGKVLEIGSFFGVVSMALKSLGYEVTASDMPEYIEMPAQKTRYAKHGISTASIRLEDFLMPFPDETFDVIIMCEVLEHLNFNPLPLLKEINRIGKPRSLFYLSLPNGAQIRNRVSVASGGCVGLTISGFFDQLDPTSPEIVHGHWREYTAHEVRQMVEPLGFRVERHYYFGLGECLPADTLRKRLARLLYKAFPTFKENQTMIAIRETRTALPFRIPKTVHRTLDAV